MGDVDVDDLYGLPLDQFVPERTALARELRKAGDRDKASEVAALKKPSVAAWAVNQLVRTQRRAITELLEAGDGLRSAQDDVLAGRGDAARGLLSSEGEELSATMVERVSDTLHAAALDEDAREQVTAGRLERELRHVGLGAFGGGPATPAPARQTPAKKTAPPEQKKPDRSARERAKADGEVRKAARAAEREARRRAERAGRAAQLALEKRDRAEEALREAEAELEAAEAEVRAAEEAVRDAETAVREASR